MRQRRRKPSHGLRIVKVRLHGETLRTIRPLERQRPRQSLQASTGYDQRSQSQRLLHHHRQRTRKNLQSTIRSLATSSTERTQTKSSPSSQQPKPTHPSTTPPTKPSP